MKNIPSKQLGTMCVSEKRSSKLSGVSGNAVHVQPKEAPIPMELRTNAALRDELHDRLKRLHEQLGPVLSPDIPSALEDSPPPAPGVLGEIEYSNRSIRAAIASINELLDRLLV